MRRSTSGRRRPILRSTASTSAMATGGNSSPRGPSERWLPSASRAPDIAAFDPGAWTEADDELGLGAKLFQKWKQQVRARGKTPDSEIRLRKQIVKLKELCDHQAHRGPTRPRCRGPRLAGARTGRQSLLHLLKPDMLVTQIAGCFPAPNRGQVMQTGPIGHRVLTGLVRPQRAHGSPCRLRR